jgi:hypothetical protein
MDGTGENAVAAGNGRVAVVVCARLGVIACLAREQVVGGLSGGAHAGDLRQAIVSMCVWKKVCKK